MPAGGSGRSFGEARDTMREIEDYDYDNPGYATGRGGRPVGHFTQVAWEDSRKLGCASCLRNSHEYQPGGEFTKLAKSTGFNDFAVL